MKAHVLKELLKKQGYELLDVYRYPDHDVLRIVEVKTQKVYKVELPTHKEGLDENGLLKALETKFAVSAERVEKGKESGKS